MEKTENVKFEQKNPEKKAQDKKPITQFFAFLDTTAGLLKSTITRYIRVSDNAWRALLGLLFIVVLWLSGDLQKFIFVAITVVLSILILIDVAIDNWGKIFRTFRHEKTFSEININSPTSITQTLNSFNVVGEDMLKLLKHLKEKNWVSMKMVDTLVSQQHLDDYAVNELLTAKLSKKDLLRVLEHYRNSANENSLKEILQKWDYSEDIVKSCLKWQISSIELIRSTKNMDRNKYKKIEELCPLKTISDYWPLKTYRIIFVFAALLTTYLLFSVSQAESLKAITPENSVAPPESIYLVTITNIAVGAVTSIIFWALLYALILPILNFVHNKIISWRFDEAFKEGFE